MLCSVFQITKITAKTTDLSDQNCLSVQGLFHCVIYVKLTVLKAVVIYSNSIIDSYSLVPITTID